MCYKKYFMIISFHYKYKLDIVYPVEVYTNFMRFFMIVILVLIIIIIMYKMRDSFL